MTIQNYCCALVCMLMVQTAHADLASSISKVKPSVVILGTYKSTNSPRFSLSGTGFVVGHGAQAMSNLVITNAHILALSRQDGSLPTVNLF